MFCGNCGTSLPDEAVSCWKCGTLVDRPIKQAPSAVTSPPHPTQIGREDRGFNTASCILAFVEAIIVFCIVGWIVPVVVFFGFGGVINPFYNRVGSSVRDFFSWFIYVPPCVATFVVIGIVWWAAYVVTLGRQKHA